MAYRMRVHELDTVTEARRQLMAEVRGLADLLDSQEPDYSALHDAWEVLLDLAEQAERLRVQFFSRHPERNRPPGAAAKSVDRGRLGGVASGAWRSARTGLTYRACIAAPDAP